MQTKEERDLAMAPASPTDAILSDDPTQIVVQGEDGRLIDWESRKGFGAQTQKLAYPKRKGFERHWFNDEPDNIAAARNAGWTPVRNALGEPEVRVVDKTTGLKGYLHEIPEAWYKADLAIAQKRADEVENSIRKGNAPGPQAPGITPDKYYGKVTLSRK